ncbi:sugar ABC transporter ATP-binding protein [Mesorhizobium sp. LHD-90]|uniref:sugar ABC transporter ATP-binding protein n=1 Tax=Mesorhizobium sp. LHD-90 TaxID=3071414 RepID=UPI0027DEAC2C|nr:sugar ABC transporter ATP-binding protein [Mesorhizobium sp. LHD-90]MDQ6438070.1 sugar ABC transporter ATP-binding protein [Mesorhizobium sp. LHD-90]
MSETVARESQAEARPSDRGSPSLVRVEGIFKNFPGVRALNDVSLTIRSGEVHALTGENGSGKSTLSRIIAGMMKPDEGRIFVDGKECTFDSPSAALGMGIVMISQELTLAPTLTVAENIFLGRLPRTRLGIVDWSRLEADAASALERLDIHVSPHARVGDLSVELRQEVEIARALSANARLLILDEATSSLSEAATARLLERVRQERDAGMAILMITHRMPEIYEVASVATVLRDGNLVATVPLPSTTESQLVRLMVGREISDFYGKRSIQAGNQVIRIRDLHTPAGALRPTSLDVRRGEIVGIAGLVGSGKSEFGLALGGAIECVGEVEVEGRPVRLGDPRSSIEAGIGLVPDDRKSSALLLVRSVMENFSLAWIDRLSRAGVLDTRRERLDVQGAIKRYRVATASAGVSIATLSGGNQQKVVLGRTFMRQPSVLVLSEPTRGIDIGAKSEIYRMLQDAAEGGAAVIVISSELPELLGVCDRIAVFFEGRLEAEFGRDEATEEAIAHVAVAGARNKQRVVNRSEDRQ